MKVVIEEWLNKQLEALGITDSELARRAGIDRSIISNAKTRNSVGPEVAVKIAKGLGRSQADVFYELGLMTEKPGEPVLLDLIAHPETLDLPESELRPLILDAFPALYIAAGELVPPPVLDS